MSPLGYAADRVDLAELVGRLDGADLAAQASRDVAELMDDDDRAFLAWVVDHGPVRVAGLIRFVMLAEGIAEAERDRIGGQLQAIRVQLEAVPL